jgi:hypothetical protein
MRAARMEKITMFFLTNGYFFIPQMFAITVIVSRRETFEQFRAYTLISNINGR